MKININGKNCEVNSTLKDYAIKKLSKLDSYDEIITSIHITFESDKIQKIAEGHIHLHGSEVHAKAHHETLHGAMDSLIDKLIKQIIKHKEKITDRR